jgi:hypothetical protein
MIASQVLCLDCWITVIIAPMEWPPPMREICDRGETTDKRAGCKPFVELPDGGIHGLGSDEACRQLLLPHTGAFTDAEMVEDEDDVAQSGKVLGRTVVRAARNLDVIVALVVAASGEQRHGNRPRPEQFEVVGKEQPGRDCGDLAFGHLGGKGVGDVEAQRDRAHGFLPF